MGKSSRLKFAALSTSSNLPLGHVLLILINCNSAFAVGNIRHVQF
jgi:hypothetical protein